MTNQLLETIATFYLSVLALAALDGRDRSDLVSEVLHHFKLEWEDLMEHVNQVEQERN